MDFWWWIEPLAKTGILFMIIGILFIALGGRSFHDIFIYIGLICLIPILIAMGASIIWFLCAILSSIWMPYF